MLPVPAMSRFERSFAHGSIGKGVFIHERWQVSDWIVVALISATGFIIGACVVLEAGRVSSH